MIKEKAPLISVIVPVYNTAQYIEECLLSIVAQDYKNLEIIVVDDGSTDNSLQIVQDIANNHQNILRVYHINNSGVSAARNFGIEQSHGEYLFFVDADDYLDRDCISYHYELLCHNQADIAVVPRPNKFHESNSNDAKKIFDSSIKCISGKDAVKEMLNYKIVISSWGKLFSKGIIDNFHIRFNEKLAYGEGFLFTIQCFHHAKKVAIGYKPVYNYRLSNSNSVMTNYKKRLVEDSLTSQCLIQKELANDKQEFQLALNYAYWHTCFDCLNTIIGAKASKVDRETLKQLRRETRQGTIAGLRSPVSKSEKLKSILYFISPTVTARFINHFRKRKFTRTNT